MPIVASVLQEFGAGVLGYGYLGPLAPIKILYRLAD